MAGGGECPGRVGDFLRFESAQLSVHHLRQSCPNALPRTSPDQLCLGEHMRNGCYLARSQLGEHSYRLLAHGRKATAEPAEAAW